MTAVTDRAVVAFTGLLPSLTIIVGVAVAGAAHSEFAAPSGALLATLILATCAPVAATVALFVVAPGHDAVLVGTAGILIALGISTLYGLALVSGQDGAFYTSIATRHALFVALGFAAQVVGVVAERSLDRARRYPFTLLILAIAITAATVLFGETVNGARLWLDVGPLRFQPSEIARLLIAIFVAVFLHERRHLLAASWRVRSLDLPPAPYLLPLAMALLIAVAVLVVQNDLGMAALVALGATATVIGVVPSRATAVMAGLLVVVALAATYLGVPRVRDRVLGWLDPWLDPAGKGFQFVQAEYSLAAGNLSGGRSAMTTGNVPEVHTDLILVAVASRFGLPIVLALLALAAMVVCRCMLAGFRAQDGFRALTAVGLASLLAIQIMLIAGGSLRVLPLTGLTFPLVSYGGTSMIVTQFALGIIVGIGARSSGKRVGFSSPPIAVQASTPAQPWIVRGRKAS